jgi:hypothetical protein
VPKPVDLAMLPYFARAAQNPGRAGVEMLRHLWVLG